jgi:hypothetical protein
MARDHNISTVHPHPHVLPRFDICSAMVAEASAVFTVNPYTLAHRNLPCELHITVASFRMIGKCKICLPEQGFDTFPRYLLCRGVLGSLFHGSWSAGFPVVLYNQRSC